MEFAVPYSMIRDDIPDIWTRAKGLSNETFCTDKRKSRPELIQGK